MDTIRYRLPWLVVMAQKTFSERWEVEKLCWSLVSMCEHAGSAAPSMLPELFETLISRRGSCWMVLPYRMPMSHLARRYCLDRSIRWRLGGDSQPQKHNQQSRFRISTI